MKQKMKKIFQKMKKIIIKILTILKILKKHENEIKGDDGMTLNDYQESVFDDRPTLLQAFKGLKDFVNKTNTENDVKFTNVNSEIDTLNNNYTNLNSETSQIKSNIETINTNIQGINSEIVTIQNNITDINARPKTVVYEKQNFAITPTETYTPENYSQSKQYVVTIYLINETISNHHIIDNTKILFNDFTMINDFGNVMMNGVDGTGSLEQYMICAVSKEPSGIKVKVSSAAFTNDMDIIVKIEEV